MFSANCPAAVSGRPIGLTISSDQAAGYNVYTAAGSPTDIVDVTVTINAGIRVSEMRALSFASGSRVFIVNNGKIMGKGGDGGGGGAISGAGSYGSGAAGTNGTDALQSNCRLIITNASGQILGGGGGGIGGRCGSLNADGSGAGCGGGGGGGGEGYPGGNGGNAGGGYSANGTAVRPVVPRVRGVVPVEHSETSEMANLSQQTLSVQQVQTVAQPETLAVLSFPTAAA